LYCKQQKKGYEKMKKCEVNVSGCTGNATVTLKSKVNNQLTGKPVLMPCCQSCLSVIFPENSKPGDIKELIINGLYTPLA
jgi:hypothetical protein